MVARKNEKLNQLAQALPEGLLVDARWLEQRGYRRQWREGYLKRGWLSQPVRGVYRRPTAADASATAWQRVVISLQALMGHKVHVGGRTALALQGFGHYAQLAGPDVVHLYADAPLPGWLRRIETDAVFVAHSAGLFPDTAPGLGELPWGHWNWTIRVSTPERALCELLDELPGSGSFDEADKMMQAAATLSPRKVQAILESCRSIKVRRLFLWLAERHGHAWLKRLDPAAIDLGRGKRQLVRNGRLDPKYLITVPDLGSVDA
jgi:Transcriptional regulator, AbiEi antitoxin, Type IV TA system/Transcriptional regulator, AbiEi antitoxin N-terminal domain